MPSEFAPRPPAESARGVQYAKGGGTEGGDVAPGMESTDVAMASEDSSCAKGGEGPPAERASRDEGSDADVGATSVGAVLSRSGAVRLASEVLSSAAVRGPAHGLVFLSSDAHAAAVVDAIGRWQPPPTCTPSLPLRLRVCTATALHERSAMTMASLFRRLPPHVVQAVPPEPCAALVKAGEQLSEETDAAARSQSALAALNAMEDSAGGDREAAAAASTLLHVSAALRSLAVPSHATSARGGIGQGALLIACVDVTDGRTLAAALAARLRRAELLNVCDLPLSQHDGLSASVHRTPQGAGAPAAALDRLVGCTSE